MEHIFPIGSVVKVIKLHEWDEKIQPEIKIGWVGRVFGTNDNDPDRVVIDFGGRLYTLFVDQLEETDYIL